ncbi:DoxX family protein [Emticicia sp. C21]|uniref:DoxX family protein n=1 Tax=Emticicia sp. C21 TaxID=2302915 RepID=UPI000E351251|nr:DoxX family protein [Emticicia sp. C21]RFS16981.1 DoxX family protein [Emticicia sp. C21]
MATPQKVLNITAWICQLLLTATLLWAAGMKLFQPIEQLAQMWPWTGDNPTLTRVTGVFDLLGGLGLTLPAALRIRPVITIYAAYSVIALMLAAIVFHISRGEGAQTGFNVFVVIVAGFVVWVRRGKVVISER